MAATQASGLRSMLDNSCKSFSVGKAASAGVIHKNQAANKKSALHKRAASL